MRDVMNPACDHQKKASLPDPGKKDPARREGLRQFILSRIEEKGAIPFSEWMEWCLYHPTFGYYQTEDVRIGKEGDYYTGPCVHPLFGSLIAKQLRQMSEIMGGESFDVIEMGAGRGFLCEDILHWARENAPAFYQRLTVTLIEKVPSLLKEQKERLAEENKAGKVVWMDPKEFEKGKESFEGCFLSNELVDSFPVHRVIFEGEGLKEIQITYQNGQFAEVRRAPSDPRIDSYFNWLGVTLPEDQKAEVNLRALDWVSGVGRCLRRGFCLTIDYGCAAEDLYAPFRQDGTLRCFHRHQISDNPYERWGEQDITAHVNFTALIRKGEEVGLKLTGFVPQYRFLLGLGFLGEMETLERNLSEIDRLRLRLSLKHLIEPEVGMGEVFKVLIQHKGIENPQVDGLKPL